MKCVPTALLAFLHTAGSFAAAASSSSTSSHGIRHLEEQEVSQDLIDRAVEKNSEYGPLTFAYLSPEAANDAVEDDIRRDLEKLGFTIESKKLSKPDLNDLRQGGDFHLTITETWGTPYDPFTTAASWLDDKGGEGFHPAFENFPPGNSRDELYDMIRKVLQVEDPKQLKEDWLAIHQYYHAQAVLLPLGKAHSHRH